MSQPCLCRDNYFSDVTPFYFSKASASVLAVAERQSLETLGREEKTTLRTLSQLKAKAEEMESRRSKLTEDSTSQEEKKSEVRA